MRRYQRGHRQRLGDNELLTWKNDFQPMSQSDVFDIRMQIPGGLMGGPNWWLDDSASFVKIIDERSAPLQGPRGGAIGLYADDGTLRQLVLYDYDGNVIYHIDKPDPRTPVWHWHQFEPGDPELGHGSGALHYTIGNFDELLVFLKDLGFTFDDWKSY